MSSITAISVTYNSEGVIGNALGALAACPHIAKIIVVDNASRDDTTDLICEQFPNVLLIDNERNEGFGRGNNKALEKVETPYALLVNPDAIVSNDVVEKLLAAAKRYPDAAILAPQLADDDGVEHLSYKRNVFAREQSAGLEQTPDGDLCADYLSGAVWLLNMTHMKKVGFFDPHIFLYYEDDDLCMRVRAAGFSCVLVADAKAIHLKGGSSGKTSHKGEFFRQQHLTWSRLYMEKKYNGLKTARKLAVKLQWEYAAKAMLYHMCMNMKKYTRYKGRIAGIRAFSASATRAPKPQK